MKPNPGLTLTLRGGVFAMLIAFLVIGCSSPPATPNPPADVYAGSGTGKTLGEAMNAAKMDAVRKAVIDLIGPQAEAANASQLDAVLYGTPNPNAFVYNDTMETLRKGGSLIDGAVEYELRIRVNRDAIMRTLDANGIPAASAASPAGGGGAALAPDGTARAAATQPAAPAGVSPSAGDWDTVTPDEERFIRRYVDTMTYMVYFSEDTALGSPNDMFIMESAVNQANSYLVADGKLVVDASQVESLARDQQLVYEEETGREVSLLQWVARRLNADVYIELNVQVSSSTSDGSHYGTADVTLNMYDTSTGQILGSVNRRSQNSFSRTSEQDAVMNAVLSTVYQAMPNAVEMARTQMATMLTRGIRYEVTIQNPPDARSLSRFRSAMRDRVREIATVNQSPEAAVYEVFVIGGTDDLVDLIYDVSARVAGFEDLVLVISRGRSMTFDAGY